jgi:hypothetical protein
MFFSLFQPFFFLLIFRIPLHASLRSKTKISRLRVHISMRLIIILSFVPSTCILKMAVGSSTKIFVYYVSKYPALNRRRPYYYCVIFILHTS